MLTCYGTLKEPEPWVPPPESVRYLNALLRRRDALVTDRSREKTDWKNAWQPTFRL
jgi:hypothetical protein